MTGAWSVCPSIRMSIPHPSVRSSISPMSVRLCLSVIVYLCLSVHILMASHSSVLGPSLLYFLLCISTLAQWYHVCPPPNQTVRNWVWLADTFISQARKFQWCLSQWCLSQWCLSQWCLSQWCLSQWCLSQSCLSQWCLSQSCLSQWCLSQWCIS